MFILVPQDMVVRKIGLQTNSGGAMGHQTVQLKSPILAMDMVPEFTLP